VDLSFGTLTFAATLASLLAGLAVTLLAVDNPDEKSLFWFAAAGYAGFVGLLIFWLVPSPRPLAPRLAANVLFIADLTAIFVGMLLFAEHRFRHLRLLGIILAATVLSYLLIWVSGDHFLVRIWWFAGLALSLCLATAFTMAGSRWKSAGLERWGGARRVLATGVAAYGGFQVVRAVIVTGQGAGAFEDWVQPTALHSASMLAALLLAAIFPWGIASMHGQKIATALHHLANHDPLTALPNRTAFVARFNAPTRKRATETEADVVAILDLDGFKAINDTHGHSAGDALLEAVAGRFQAALRPEDTVARLGGDEFVVLLRGTDAQSAQTVIRRMTNDLASIELPEPTAALACSAGLAARPTDGTSFDALYNAADERLYQAKRHGKGCAVLPDGTVFSTAPKSH
jgi:diguanylate cyclase (GGDEF)-like protein